MRMEIQEYNRSWRPIGAGLATSPLIVVIGGISKKSSSRGVTNHERKTQLGHSRGAAMKPIVDRLGPAPRFFFPAWRVCTISETGINAPLGIPIQSSNYSGPQWFGVTAVASRAVRLHPLNLNKNPPYSVRLDSSVNGLMDEPKRLPSYFNPPPLHKKSLHTRCLHFRS